MMDYLAVRTLLTISLLQSARALDCFVSQDNRMVQTVCEPGESCCGTGCCQSPAHFYTHWYFWLAVSMLLVLILGFAVSAFCHYRRERKYRHHYLRAKSDVMDSFILNYHKALANLVSLPPYEEHDITGTINRGAVPQSPPPPPAYNDIDKQLSGSCCSISLPPSYTQTLLADHAGDDDYNTKLIADAPTMV